MSSTAQKVVIRAINVKTGKPVQGYDSYNPVGLWLYDQAKKPIPIRSTPESYHQQSSEIQELQNADSIQIFANGYIDCRKVKGRIGPYYSVTEILSDGIVTVNHCNGLTVSSVPGTIVLFVRPPNWFERHFRE